MSGARAGDRTRVRSVAEARRRVRRPRLRGRDDREPFLRRVHRALRRDPRLAGRACCCVSLGLALLPLAAWAPAGVALLVIAPLVIGAGYGPITPASSQVLARTAPPSRMALTFSIKQTGVPGGAALGGAMLPALTLVAWLARDAACACGAGSSSRSRRNRSGPTSTGSRDRTRSFTIAGTFRPLRKVFANPLPGRAHDRLVLLRGAAGLADELPRRVSHRSAGLVAGGRRLRACGRDDRRRCRPGAVGRDCRPLRSTAACCSACSASAAERARWQPPRIPRARPSRRCWSSPRCSARRRSAGTACNSPKWRGIRRQARPARSPAPPDSLASPASSSVRRCSAFLAAATGDYRTGFLAIGSAILICGAWVLVRRALQSAKADADVRGGAIVTIAASGAIPCCNVSAKRTKRRTVAPFPGDFCVAQFTACHNTTIDGIARYRHGRAPRGGVSRWPLWTPPPPTVIPSRPRNGWTR